MLPKNSELTLLDLIEIFLSKKFLIIFLTTIIGIFFCILHVNFYNNKNFKSIIHIYPKLLLEIEEINQLHEIKQNIQNNILDIDRSDIKIDNDKSIIFDKSYSSPARIVYEFADIFKKNSLNNNYFKIIRSTPIKHPFFLNHVNYFEFEFSFDDPIKAKSEIIKILNNTSRNIKQNYILSLKELDTELVRLEKRLILKEIKNVDELIAINSSKDSIYRKEVENINIFIDKNSERLNYNTPLHILTEKKKLLELKLNQEIIFTKDIKKLISIISKEDFQFIEYDLNDKYIDNLVKSNFTYYIIYFVLALIISLIYAVANYLYNNKKKLFS